MYTTALTATSVTNLYLYGQLGIPPKDRSSIIRPDSSSTTIEVSEDAFMTTGAGRFANGARSDVVNAFFDTGNPIAAGSYSLSAMKTMLGQESEFTLLQLGLDDGEDDWAERVWIYNHTDFDIDPDATFVVESDGSRHIEDFAIRPQGDNFDFLSSGITTYANIPAEYLVDPWGIGRVVDILFTGSVSYTTYTSTMNAAYTIDNIANVGADPIDAVDMFSELYNSGTINFSNPDGLALSYGSTLSDVLYASHIDGHFNLDGAASEGNQGFLGTGDDAFFGDIGRKFVIDGGSGDDVADFSQNAEALDIRTVDVEEIYGSDQDDVIAIDQTTDRLIDGGAGRNILTFEASGSALNTVFGTNGPVDFGLSISNIHEFGGTEFGDTIAIYDEFAQGMTLRGMGGDDVLTGSIGADVLYGDDGVDQLIGGEGSDTLNSGSGTFTDWSHMSGGAGDDIFFAGIGFDSANGGDGADTFHMTELEYADGDAGNDTYLIATGDGVNTSWDPNIRDIVGQNTVMLDGEELTSINFISFDSEPNIDGNGTAYWSAFGETDADTDIIYTVSVDSSGYLMANIATVDIAYLGGEFNFIDYETTYNSMSSRFYISDSYWSDFGISATGDSMPDFYLSGPGAMPDYWA